MYASERAIFGALTIGNKFHFSQGMQLEDAVMARL